MLLAPCAQLRFRNVSKSGSHTHALALLVLLLLLTLLTLLLLLLKTEVACTSSRKQAALTPL